MDYVTVNNDSALNSNSEQNLKKRHNVKNIKENEEQTPVKSQTEKIKESFNATIVDSLKDFKNQFFKPKVYLVGFISYLISLVLNYLNETVNDEVSHNELLEDYLDIAPVRTFLMMCIALPVIEELIYRKIIFGFLSKYSKILAYIISCFLFSFGHFEHSFDVLMDEIYTLPFHFLGAINLTLAYDYTGCLLASIISHILNNITFVISILYKM